MRRKQSYMLLCVGRKRHRFRVNHALQGCLDLEHGHGMLLLHPYYTFLLDLRNPKFRFFGFREMYGNRQRSLGMELCLLELQGVQLEQDP